jgi:hypothetical protein
MSPAELRRYEDIVNIQNMLSEGYAPVRIKEILNTTYHRIRRYATGDPAMLCRFSHGGTSMAGLYDDVIIPLPQSNIPKSQIMEQITGLGYQGKRSAFEAHCRKLVLQLGIDYQPKRNASGTAIDPKKKASMMHYISRSDLERFLWSGKELPPDDVEYIFTHYPHIKGIHECIASFRRIYAEKDVGLLDQFIEEYSTCQLPPIKSFASGLRGDLDAVRNSVTSDLSNGFVEGINNKIKMIKRVMFGRAKIDLLRIKILFAR